MGGGFGQVTTVFGSVHMPASILSRCTEDLGKRQADHMGQQLQSVTAAAASQSQPRASSAHLAAVRALMQALNVLPTVCRAYACWLCCRTAPKGQFEQGQPERMARATPQQVVLFMISS